MQEAFVFKKTILTVPVFQVKDYRPYRQPFRLTLMDHRRHTVQVTSFSEQLSKKLYRTNLEPSPWFILSCRQTAFDIEDLPAPPDLNDLIEKKTIDERKSWPPPLSLDRTTAFFSLVKYLGGKIRNSIELIVPANKNKASFHSAHYSAPSIYCASGSGILMGKLKRSN